MVKMLSLQLKGKGENRSRSSLFDIADNFPSNLKTNINKPVSESISEINEDPDLNISYFDQLFEDNKEKNHP